MHFRVALTLLRKGRKVTRSGWNDKGLYIVLVPAKEFLFSEMVEFLAIKNVNNNFCPWTPSQTDALANDWEEVSDIQKSVRNARTGDYIETTVDDSFGNFKKGKIIYIDGKKNRAGDSGFIWGENGVGLEEYVVLDNYKPEKLVKRRAVTGEFIKITNKHSFHGAFDYGDICEVIGNSDDYIQVRSKHNSNFSGKAGITQPFSLLDECEYVVIENYKPKK